MGYLQGKRHLLISSTGLFTPTDGSYEGVDNNCNILQAADCFHSVMNSLTSIFFHEIDELH